MTLLISTPAVFWTESAVPITMPQMYNPVTLLHAVWCQTLDSTFPVHCLQSSQSATYRWSSDVFAILQMLSSIYCWFDNNDWIR